VNNFYLIFYKIRTFFIEKGLNMELICNEFK
jgi:hypothetical protein